MKIPMFAPVYDVEACLKNIKDCLEKGWTGQGYKTIEFEEEWKRYTGHSNAHFLTTATAGLNLVIETLKEEYGWNDGDEIISTPLTFVASNNCILFSNLKPVFADVDCTLCLDPEDVERKITSKTRAVIFVGLGGTAGNYEKIEDICIRHNLKIILDAAHMAGTKLHGETVGLKADAVVYSFHVTKNLSLAEGGMVCFKERQLDEIIRKKTFNGIDKSHAPMSREKHNTWDYDVKYLADAYNGNSIMASIGLAQLPHLDKENEIRRTIARQYDDLFSQYSDRIKLPSKVEGCVSSTWLYQIIVEKRDELLQYLTGEGIGCGIHYPVNTLYWMYENQHGICKNATYYSEHLITLPLHINLTTQEICEVANKVIKFTGEFRC